LKTDKKYNQHNGFEHKEFTAQKHSFATLFISACGNEILQADSGSISTPGYPSRYTRNLQCSWTIKTTFEKVYINEVPVQFKVDVKVYGFVVFIILNRGCICWLYAIIREIYSCFDRSYNSAFHFLSWKPATTVPKIIWKYTTGRRW